MLRWIIGTSLKLRFLIIVLAAVLMLFGIMQLGNMPVDIYPEIDPPMVEVQTEALGLSAEEVEAMLTVPMEADLLNGVAWLDRIYSESVDGLSSILLIFEPDADPLKVRQMVQERLTETYALPNVSKPPVMLQPLSASSRAMMAGLSSDDLSMIELGVLARWVIKPRLMGVPGVANVAVWGQRERQLQVLVDPEQLHAEGMTLDQIIKTTGEALWVSPLTFLESANPGTAGWIDTPNQRLGVRHLLPISNPEDLAKVAVIDGDGLLLSDVAEVVEDHQPLIGDATLDDGPGVLLVIEKFPGANTLEVTRGVEEAFAALAPGLPGVQVDSNIFRPANYIEQATSNLSTMLLIGAVLMIVVIGLFFLNWRTALISIVVIPLSLVMATYVLYLRGETFNPMILMGLVVALGVIVDDAIIDVDQIWRRLRQRGDDSAISSEDVVLGAAVEMRGPIGYATFIVLLAAVPVFFLSGVSGAFMQPAAVSYVMAVLVSLVVALLVTPALSLTLLSNTKSGPGESAVVRGLQKGYNAILAPAVKAPIASLVIALVVILVGLVAASFLDVSLLPDLKQTDLLVAMEAAPGASRGEMNRIASQASRELEAIPGVRSVDSHVGRAITGDAVVGINSGELWISLDPAADYDATVAEVQAVVAGYPGMLREVQTYQPERLAEVLTSPGQDVVVRVYGHEFDVLREKATEVTALLTEMEGVTDVQAVALVEEPQVEIEVDMARAEQYGLAPGEVRRQAATLLSGLQVGSLFEEQKVFDVMVWGVPEIRENLTSIEELLIDTPAGGQVRLQEVADVRIAPAAVSIKRDAVSRYIDVGANVSGRSLATAAAEIDSALSGIEIPLEYHMEVLGLAEQKQGNRQQVLLVALFAVLGAFLLMQAAFDSWTMAFVAALVIPMALVGGVFAAFLGGSVLSLGSFGGFLAVFAITVRNTIVMVRHYQHIERVEGEPFGFDLALRGARERLGPILMTALTTGFALLPLVIPGSIAGNEIVRPVAIVVLGGLVTATLLNLLVMPALYLKFGYVAEPEEIATETSEEPQLEAA